MDPIVSFFGFALGTSIVYILAGQAMTLAGHTGIFIIYNEGLMQASASAAFLAAYLTQGNIMLGLLAGAVFGGIFGLIMSILTVTLKHNQFVVGLALFIMLEGLANFMYKGVLGVASAPTQVPVLQGVAIPLLSEIPYLGPILFQQNAIFYTSIVLSVVLWYVLYRTRFGLNLRSVGENPRVADTQGINVFVTRYAFTILGSMVMGLAGAYIPFYFTGSYTQTLVGGRGWISIAVTLLGGWNPLWVIFSGLIFAGFEVFAVQSQFLNLPLSPDFLLMVPFIATLAILIHVYRTAELPQGLGKAYDREARTEIQ